MAKPISCSDRPAPRGPGPTASTCPARKWDSAGDLQVFRLSGGVRVLVDQAAQDGFSADLLSVDAGHRGAGSVRIGVGDALRYALVRPGRVVVRLVVGQDGAKVSLAEDQYAVQELTAQGAGEAFAGGVHTWSLDRARCAGSWCQRPGRRRRTRR